MFRTLLISFYVFIATVLLACGENTSHTSAWSLVWQDEFNGDTIDANKWSYQLNCAGGGNNELQCYTDSEKNSFVENGALNIRAIEEPVSGYDGWDGVSGALVMRNYSSARMMTRYKGDWRFARIEVSAQLPYGQGIWPAIWLLPTDSVYGSAWPLSGEVDIMEAINLKTESENHNRIFQTIHFGAVPPDNKQLGEYVDLGFDVTAGFHTYALEWQRGEMRWYIDNMLVATQNHHNWSTDGNSASSNSVTEAKPFDQAFHLILNIAVGGNWPGSPDDKTVFPQVLKVDFVRVYECAINPQDGIGCATNSGAPLYE